MADPASGGDHVVTEDALFSCPDPEECRAGFLIRRVGLELDPNAL